MLKSVSYSGFDSEIAIIRAIWAVLVTVIGLLYRVVRGGLVTVKQTK